MRLPGGFTVLYSSSFLCNLQYYVPVILLSGRPSIHFSYKQFLIRGQFRPSTRGRRPFYKGSKVFGS